ncbi:prepilin-type N-terminal cleavage/methylation domain-containing protein [Clostridium pasteurianum]|uniref:type II secretion system protein n=1 Tax=Clostridium pasteurianum TaxID=1501 RepID=UPI002260AD8C|nr:prepilin-type N-terminal cleavage/methylation domain-containing protein [Clostridium pasteurianum]UZW15740.1 prepilin-type N-terminal cleavage/methylation domain-containing protein [Clostridium pasteurianum]
MKINKFKLRLLPGKSIKSKNKKKGFTLIEVIAVIAILAIMGAILVPNVLGYREKAQKSNIQTSAKTIMNTIEAYNSDKTSGEDQIGDDSGKITYKDGIDKLIEENMLDSDKIPDCLKGVSEPTTVEKLSMVAAGDFSIEKFDGKASTISINTDE